MNFSRLRKLEAKDADGMLEWMTDPEQAQYFTFDSHNITRDSVLKFIEDAQDFSKNRHYAAVNEDDEYMGTISLKNIDLKNKNAEYAVSFRKKFIGGGIAFIATEEILRIAFNELGLHKVYLNVLSTNERAIHFYQKLGFKHEGKSVDHIFKNGKYEDLEWYAIFVEDYDGAN